MQTEIEKMDILAAGDGGSVPGTTSCGHLVHKTYRFRICPNSEQRTLLARHFGCCRFVYNHFLRVRTENSRKIGLYDTHRMVAEMKKDSRFEWLKEVASGSLQASLRNLDVACRRVSRKGGAVMKLHSKRDRQSVAFPSGVKVVGRGLVLPKFKTPIKMKMSRPLGGRLRRATVSLSPTGKYHVSILCEEACGQLPPTGKSVGIDLGIKDLAVCSDGERVANPKFLEKSERRLKRLQRQLEKKRKGSKRRLRARMMLARCHEKVVNQRKNFIHRFTNRIIRENQTICVENLNVKGMQANHHLAKNIGSVAFGEIVRQLEYKSKWYGRDFVKVGRWYPSTKTCHECGHVHRGISLGDREWTCPVCGSLNDRDLNAARNIRTEGLRILSGVEAPSDGKQKGGEAAALAASKNRSSPRILDRGRLTLDGST